MTTPITGTLLTSSSFNAGSDTVAIGVLAIVFLLAVLAQREFLRAYHSPRSTAWLRISDIVVFPLLLAFLILAVYLLGFARPL